MIVQPEINYYMIITTPTDYRLDVKNEFKFVGFPERNRNSVMKFKEGDKIIGNQINVKIVKNKVAPPFKEAEFDIMYGEGISKVGEIVDLGVQVDVIQKSGAWFSYNDQKIGQGRENVKIYLMENPEIMAEIEEKIKECRDKLFGSKKPRLPKATLSGLKETTVENVPEEPASKPLDIDIDIAVED